MLCQAFRTSRPYLRMSGPPDGKHQCGVTQRPQSSQRICSPPVTSRSVVNDWDKIRWPEGTSLPGQSWEFMGPEWTSFIKVPQNGHKDFRPAGEVRQREASRPCWKACANALEKVNVGQCLKTKQPSLMLKNKQNQLLQLSPLERKEFSWDQKKEAWKEINIPDKIVPTVSNSSCWLQFFFSVNYCEED